MVQDEIKTTSFIIEKNKILRNNKCQICILKTIKHYWTELKPKRVEEYHICMDWRLCVKMANIPSNRHIIQCNFFQNLQRKWQVSPKIHIEMQVSGHLNWSWKRMRYNHVTLLQKLECYSNEDSVFSAE